MSEMSEADNALWNMAISSILPLNHLFLVLSPNVNPKFPELLLDVALPVFDSGFPFR